MTARPGTAVVTGASSGIGLAFADALASRGHDLLLVARGRERLEAVAREIAGRHGVTATPLAVDLATPEGCAAVREAADGAGDVDAVVLNAGVGAMGEVAALGRERQVAMVALNCDAVVDLACHVLPEMIARRRGTIVIVSSAAAWQPIPHTAVYAATKAFELHFAEALADEVDGSGVRVIACCPGPTRSGFGRAAGIPDGPRWMPRETPQGVVAATFRALERGRSRVATGRLAKVTTTAASLLPRRAVVWAAGAVHRRMGRERRR